MLSSKVSISMNMQNRPMNWLVLHEEVRPHEVSDSNS